jgi:hypothetical protein
MLKIIKSIVLFTTILIGYSLVTGRIDLIKNLEDTFNIDKLKTSPVYNQIADLISRDNTTVSGILTYTIIFIGIVYIILHLIEFIAKQLARLFNFDHRPHETKHKVRKIFFYAIWTKIILLGLQIVLLMTQAWSLSKFFHYLIEKPTDFWGIVTSDTIFLAILLLLILLKTIEGKTEPEREVFHVSQ